MPINSMPGVVLITSDKTTVPIKNNNLTNQVAFEKSARHLLKQKSRSTQFDLCVYRNSNGSSCAVGCLIPDDQYKAEFENQSIANIINDIPALVGVSQRLLGHLQSIHDWVMNPNEWLVALRKTGKEFGLDTKFLDN